MFNEGVDLPHVDSILMLRPTESRILWLQQFGRGLRWLPGKTLRVIETIGNHRVFLNKTRALFDLGNVDREVAFALERLEAGTQELPPRPARGVGWTSWTPWGISTPSSSGSGSTWARSWTSSRSPP